MFVLRFTVAYVVVNFIKKDLREKHGARLFSKETTMQLGNQFSVCFMGMLMGVWGWWAFDIFTLMASYLSIEAVDAQTIMRTLGLLTYMIPVGISAASGILLGNSIGEGSAKKVHFWYRLSLYLAILSSLFQNVLLFAFRDQIIWVYTSNKSPAIAS